MKKSIEGVRAWQLAAICASVLMMDHAAVAGTVLQPGPTAYPLYCQGRLHTSGTSTPFKWASKGAAAEAPGAGECAWADRGPRGSEIKSGNANVIKGSLSVCFGDFNNLKEGKYLELLVYKDSQSDDMDLQSVVGYVTPPFSVNSPLPQPPLCTQPK